MWKEKYERENEEAIKPISENSLQNNGRIASKNKCNVFFFRLDKCLRSFGLSIGYFFGNSETVNAGERIQFYNWR